MTLRPIATAGGITLSLAFALAGFYGTAISTQHASAVEASTTSATSLPCFVDRATSPTSTDQGTSGTQVRISVEVASTTRLQLHANGELKAVGTNTGCAPKATDEFIVLDGDTYSLATSELTAAALRCETSSGWEETTHMHACK